MARAGMRVARALFRKTRMTRMTRIMAMKIVWVTSLIDSRMKLEES